MIGQFTFSRFEFNFQVCRRSCRRAQSEASLSLFTSHSLRHFIDFDLHKSFMTDHAVDVNEFYKSRIENFHVERDVFTKYLGMIQPNKGELHVLDWEYRSGIENAASAVHERQTIINDLQKRSREIEQKKQELSAMRSQQEYRIAQIQRLSELSQPVQRDTTYVVKDRYAARAAINMYSGVTITNGHIDIDSLSDSSEAGSQNGDGSGRKHAKDGHRKQGATHDGARNAIKSLRTGEVMMLEAKLEEETRKLNTSIEDLEISLKEVTVGTKALDKVVTHNLDLCREEAAALISEVDRLDHQGFLSVSELLSLRLRISVAQREEIEELAQLKSDREFFAARETQMREQLLSDMALMKRRLKAEATNSTRDFHGQALALDTQLLKLRKKQNSLQEEMHQVEKTGVDQLTAKLKDQLKFSEERYTRLRQRNALETEGYNNEAAQLKTKLAGLEKLFEKQRSWGPV